MKQDLTPTQSAAITAGDSSFLLGPAGTGKSTALRQRLLRLLQEGETAYTMLVLVAEPEHRPPFLDTIHAAGIGPYADLDITTYHQLARRLVALFWPLVARPAGFARPYQPPAFLNYDLAQVLMWRVVTPLVDEGAFANLRLRPQQIVSQILDTLNRAALNSLTLAQASARQMAAWVGEPEHLGHLQDAAEAAGRFRRICLENSLLDLSLTIQVFDTQVVHHAEFRRYFQERYRHLLVDNVEEQPPAGQNFVAELMEFTQTTAIAYDAGGGYKHFLGADPLGANRFAQLCRQRFEFNHTFTSTRALAWLGRMVEVRLLGASGKVSAGPRAAGEDEDEAKAAILKVVSGRYRHEMISRLAPVLARLIHEEAIPPQEIAVITPYLDEALRYKLTQALAAAGVPYRVLRRRTSPRNEPRARAWLTWLVVAHPLWNLHPSAYDVAEALSLSIHSLDPARAALVAQHLYQADIPALRPVDALEPRFTPRIGLENLELVEELRRWLEANGGRLPPDVFLQRLFTEVLSQRRFQPEPDLPGAAVCDWLVRSAGRLRQASQSMGLEGHAEVGRAFVTAINQGLVSADPPELGEPQNESGVLISTIYGYLLAGGDVQVQVWLEASGNGWWDIPRQPLSNAFVLTQSWPEGRGWTMDEEFNVRNELLSRIVRGLVARCRAGVILAASDLDRRGARQEGPLWRALRPVVKDEG